MQPNQTIPSDIAGSLYGLSEQGLSRFYRVGTAEPQWHLIRPMAHGEIGRVRLACAAAPERATRLVILLDPERRLSPVDPAEEWAQQLLQEMLGQAP